MAMTSDLEQRLQAIEQRNLRVDMEKAWEVSVVRRTWIMGMTYLTATVFLWITGNPYPLLNALVPTGGYLLSTLSLPWIKARWAARRRS